MTSRAWSDAFDSPFGGTATTVSGSDRLWRAALIMAIRYQKLPQAAFGVAGGYDVGALYIGRLDDYNSLLRGYRSTTISSTQAWPTVDDVKAELNVSSNQYDGLIGQALDAAIEQVKQDVQGAFGVG